MMNRSATPEVISIPPRVLDADFAGWLRDAMAERGLTTRILAMRTGVDHSSIWRLMNGEREPKLSTAVALLRVLGPEPLRFGAPTRRVETAELAR
jgi:transcriptional regulator with XRE-family HTH domain